MPEKVNHCPLCKNSRSSLFDQRDFHGNQVSNRICDSCGFVYQSPIMTKIELGDFYAREYREVYQGDEGPTQKDLLVQGERAFALLEFVKNSLSKVTRHLDIGCSAGLLLEKIHSHFGGEMMGVEPGEAYRNHSKQKNIQVYSDIEAIDSVNESRFDLVSMAHVLEHIPDPIRYLINLREKFLESDGWLLLEVPNLYFHDSFEIAHMSSFSLHTLKQTLLQSGFEIVAQKKHGNPRSVLFPLYLTVLAQPNSKMSSEAVQSEKWVKIKRNTGMLVRKIVQRLFPEKAWVPLKTENK